jgi:hypothetical protein
MEACKKTSTAARRIVGGVEKGTRCLWGITGRPCHWGDINTETWSSGFGAGRKAEDLAL